MIKKIVLLLLLPSLVWALDVPKNNAPKDTHDEQLQKNDITKKKADNPPPAPTVTVNKKGPVAYDEQSLLANPPLLKRAMQSVLMTKQTGGIRVILPIYQKLPDADPTQIKYGQAQLAQADGKLRKAIDLYREIIAQQPKASGIRVDLANALIRNKQFSAAREQFKHLNPALLKRMMQNVLTTKQTDVLRVILPIYQKLPGADPIQIKYGQAQRAQADGKLRKAIDLYREIIAQQPKASGVRFDLALALARNKQFSAARDQFKRLQSEKLDKRTATFIAQMIKHIDRQEDWQFSVNFYPRIEDNINNFPENGKSGALSLRGKPEKAHGFHLDLGATKRFNLNDNLYSNIALSTSSDYFWDNHKYDDHRLKLAAGIGYQNAKFSTELKPFISKRFYGNKPYSLTTGIGASLSYQLTPRLSLSPYAEWSYESIRNAPAFSGHRKFVSLSAFYRRNPRQYFSGGVNYYSSDARDDYDKYHRKGVFVAWGQEWPKGVSSSVRLSTARRDHKAMTPLIGVKRSDKEYGARISLWRRQWHLWGLTPRLVWSWNKTNSNDFRYRLKKSTFTLEVSKSF